ncbi:MAG: HD domain-containing phosphohydrolase, partial [Acidobacteriota bacterium]
FVVSVIEATRHSLSAGGWLVFGLIVLSRPFTVRLPEPLPALSTSPWLAFACAPIFGPGAATLSVVLAEMWGHQQRRTTWTLDGLFDVFEPPISFWIASQLFLILAAQVASRHDSAYGAILQVLPALVLATAYFAAHSTLTAMAGAFRSGRTAMATWREDAIAHALTGYLILWVTLLASDASGAAMLIALLASTPLALSYLGYRGFTSLKAKTDRHTQALEEFYEAAIEALAVAVDTKDQITHGHIRRVQRHTIALAKALGVRDALELRAMEAASLLHDIGKLAVPDYVLNKPGVLTRHEFAIMKEHAGKGASILTAIGFPYPVVPIVRHHHEQWNGKGYPDGLDGDRIPLGARVLAVVDCFDALTSDRPYRRKLSADAAVEILLARKGEFYDPAIVDAFITLIPQLRDEDGDLDDAHPVHASVAEARTDPTPESAEGTLALRVDLTTPDAVGKLLRVRIGKWLPDAEWCLFMPDAAGGRLWPIHASAALRPAVAPLHLRVGQGLAGWVAANRHTIINALPDLDVPDAAVTLDLQRCVCTPVFAFGTIAGVLSVYTHQVQGFSESEIRLVGAIAQELGVEFARHDRTLAYDITPIEDAPPLATAG